MLRSIFEFLEVDCAFIPDMRLRHMPANVPRSPRLYRLVRPITHWAPSDLRRSLKRLTFRSRGSLAMDPRDRAFLVDFYREDILNLAQLLNRDLSAWL
jgi:hypothetical protein